MTPPQSKPSSPPPVLTIDGPAGVGKTSVAARGVAVNDCAAIETSFPGFVATAARAGLDVGAP